MMLRHSFTRSETRSASVWRRRLGGGNRRRHTEAFLLAFLLALPLFAQESDTSCPLTPQCTEGTEPFAPLNAAEVTNIVNAAASALNVDTATIAVVDRSGRPLALFRQPNAAP